jgi:mannonate dehydratase
MDRRSFFTSSGAGAVALAAGAAALVDGSSVSPAQAQPAGRAGGLPPLKVLVGHEARADEKTFTWLARYGVEAVGCMPQSADPTRLYPTVDELHAMRDLAEKHGLKVTITSSVLLNSTNVDREAHPAIMLAQSPERDRDIEAFQTHIKNCAEAGIPTLKYNMSILGVLRSDTIPGRGDATYGGWNRQQALAKGEPPPTKAGPVNADAFWERIDYFLSHVVPVANQYKVNIACHPQDPGTTGTWQGVDRVLGTVDGLKKFVSMHESPYHGLNFCQGTISEDLEDPNAQIGDVIRYFGSRKKVFNVHFRNIRGKRDNFHEVFWDEGSVDFVKALKVWREVGYDKALMPDHPIRVPNDQNAGNESFAYAFGYFRGLIQAEQHIV